MDEKEGGGIMNKHEISRMIKENHDKIIELEESLEQDDLIDWQRKEKEFELIIAYAEKEMLLEYKFKSKVHNGFRNYLVKGA